MLACLPRPVGIFPYRLFLRRKIGRIVEDLHMNWFKRSWYVDNDIDYDRDSISIYTRNQKEYHRQRILSYRKLIQNYRRRIMQYRKKDDHNKVHYYQKKINHCEKRIHYHQKRVLYYQRKEDQAHLKEKQKIRDIIGL